MAHSHPANTDIRVIILQSIFRQMNFLRSKMAGIFFQNNPPPPPVAMTNPPKDKTNSSDIFEVLEECPEYEQILQQFGVKAPVSKPQKYYIIENQYFNDVMVEKDQEARMLTHEQWQQIIKNYSYEGICRKNLIFSILKGIPFDVRKQLWQVLAECKKMKSELKHTYEELLHMPNCKSMDIIKKDVPRTQNVQRFQRELENILVAYSNLDPCGYTQGMNLIVGSLLDLLCIENDRLIQKLQFEVIELEFEERVFWVFVGIMYGKNWRECFEGMRGVMRMLGVLESLMKKFVPNILAHIQNLQLDLNMCFSQYYLTLVIYNTPRGLAKRILDLFLLQGERAIHSVILRMMKICEDRILAMNDMGELIRFFKKNMLEECYEQIKKQKSSACTLQDFAINFFNLSPE